MKGKYTRRDDVAIQFATGLNIARIGNKAIITFFNEVPAFPSEYEMQINEAGEVIYSADQPTDFLSERRIVASVEMDTDGLKQLLAFAQNVIEDKMGDNND